MQDEQDNATTKIEFCLVSQIEPTFLAITEEEENLYHVIIVHPSFILLNMPERVDKVYEALKKCDPTLLKNNVIVVQAFCSSEFEALFDYWL